MSAELPVFKDEEYPPDLELKLLQIVHRHGERSPARKRLEHIFPTVWNLCTANEAMFTAVAQFDNQQKESSKLKGLDYIKTERIIETSKTDSLDVPIRSGACFNGQLTDLGRYRMTLLGKNIREHYIKRLNFLPDVYDEKSMYIRSSDCSRTIESVQQLIAGGVYPAGKRSTNKDGEFKLKIRVRDLREDVLFSNPKCDRLQILARQFEKSVSEMMKDKFASLSSRLKDYVEDVSLTSQPSANGILDSLIAAKSHGFEIPKEFDDKVTSDLEEIVVKEWFYGISVSNEVRRLTLGRLMGSLRDRMVRREQGLNDSNVKLAIYSGHDTTIAPLLIMLDVYDERWPPFGSAVLLELFKQKGTSKHFVRVKYNENNLKLPGCALKGQHKEGDPSLCTLDAFKKIVQDQVPSDWEKECSI